MYPQNVFHSNNPSFKNMINLSRYIREKPSKNLSKYNTVIIVGTIYQNLDESNFHQLYASMYNVLLLLGLKKDFMSTVITVNTVIYQNMDASIITDWDTFVNIAQKYFELHLVEI